MRKIINMALSVSKDKFVSWIDWIRLVEVAHGTV